MEGSLSELLHVRKGPLGDLEDGRRLESMRGTYSSERRHVPTRGLYVHPEPSHPQMSPDPTFSASQIKAQSPGICDMPTEVLVLIFRGLRGQDIALCMGVSVLIFSRYEREGFNRGQVCRCFADIVRSEDGLQYKIELVRNGMVDGDSSTLFPSERLQRLHQYSSNFPNGIFDHETFPRVDDTDINADGSLTSVFIYGSAQAGIKSRHWMTPLGTPGGPRRLMCNWAIDRAQDLLAVIEEVETITNGQLSRFVFSSSEKPSHFYSYN